MTDDRDLPGYQCRPGEQTALEKYQAQRNRISVALKLAGVAETPFIKDNIPKNLPCIILILDSEIGWHGTSRQYVLREEGRLFSYSV